MFVEESLLIEEMKQNVSKLWGPKAYSQPELAYLDGIRVDLCVKTPRLLIAIEAKLYDWRRALAQAYGHRLGFDRSYVALPDILLKPHIVEEAFCFDIGVIRVAQGRCTIVRRAPSLRPYGVLRNEIEGYMERGPHQ